MHEPSYRPYSSFTEPPRRGARWPWAAGFVALVALVAITGLLVRGNLQVDGPGEQGSPVPSSSEVALAAITATAQPPDVNPIPTAAPTEVFTPTAIDTSGSVRVAENWLAAWQSGDYSAMYDMTSTTTQKAITREDFVARYQGITDKAALSKVEAKVTGAPGLDGKVPFTITMSSALVGISPSRMRFRWRRKGIAGAWCGHHR